MNRREFLRSGVYSLVLLFCPPIPDIRWQPQRLVYPRKEYDGDVVNESDFCIGDRVTVNFRGDVERYVVHSVTGSISEVIVGLRKQWFFPIVTRA